MELMLGNNGSSMYRKDNMDSIDISKRVRFVDRLKFEQI